MGSSLRSLYRDDCFTCYSNDFGVPRPEEYEGANYSSRSRIAFGVPLFADEHWVWARITVYWHREGSGEHASWSGTQLREEHCAVDPKRIPYGSKIVFPDAECVAVDSGPDLVNRKAARSCGRKADERNAIVIDRFFGSKQKALTWAQTHPHFMTVRILTPDVKLAGK